MNDRRLAAVSPDVVVADFDTELVVLVPERRRAHLLEPMWAVVFDSCRAGDMFSVVVDDLRQATGSSPDVLGAWVDSAVTSLIDAGVLLADS